MGLFRRKKLPPPLDPQLPPAEPELALPYALADYPRQVLHWLARSKALDEQWRELIGNLILGYDQELLSFLWMNYGFPSVLEADEISKKVGAAFYTAVDEAYTAKESELLQFLEEDLRKGEGDE